MNYVATYIMAPIDRYGNPRKGWLVNALPEDFSSLSFSASGIAYPDQQTVFVEEGYDGFMALMSRFPKVVITNNINITAKEYQAWQRYERERLRTGIATRV